jgi:hypothetical protein
MMRSLLMCFYPMTYFKYDYSHDILSGWQIM